MKSMKTKKGFKLLGQLKTSTRIKTFYSKINDIRHLRFCQRTSEAKDV